MRAAGAEGKEQVDLGGVKVEREWLDAIKKIAAHLKATEMGGGKEGVSTQIKIRSTMVRW